MYKLIMILSVILASVSCSNERLTPDEYYLNFIADMMDTKEDVGIRTKSWSDCVDNILEIEYKSGVGIINPSETIKIRKANCVSYAILSRSIFQYEFMSYVIMANSTHSHAVAIFKDRTTYILVSNNSETPMEKINEYENMNEYSMYDKFYK